MKDLSISADELEMSTSNTRLNIGLPVFNGEKYLEKALDSLLSQTYKDFKLIICDNASTDKTEQICRKYAKIDARVHYYRNKTNVGGPANYNLVFKLSSSKYFKWAAYDDVHAPDYLQKCLEVLDDDPSVVLSHSRNGRIDQYDNLVGTYDEHILSRISSDKPHERFGDLISLRNPCWSLYGVMRSGALKRTPLHGDYILADRNLLAELGLMGRFYEIPEHLFFRRDHPEAYTSTYYSKSATVRDYRNQSKWWTGKKGKTMSLLPHWKHCFEFFRSVNRVPLNPFERYLCYNEIAKWVIKEKGYRLMKWDLTNALELWRMSLKYG